MLVVLGFLGLTGMPSDERVATWSVAVSLLLLIPSGLVLLWEAEVAWPRDGSVYPWRRRATGLLPAVLTFVVMALVHVSVRATLPRGWVADVLTQATAIAAGSFVFRRLRACATRRLAQGTPSTEDTAST